MRILVIHGPNLNLLGQREPKIYGRQTLAEINDHLAKRAQILGVELVAFQANSEGAIIDFIQEQAPKAKGIIVNPGALTHYGLSLRDCLASITVPAIEVHLSNIYAREDWRHDSVIAPVVLGQISGFGWRSYAAALDALVAHLAEEQE